MQKKIFLVKVKLSHYRHERDMGKRIYSSNSFMASVLGEWSASRPGHALAPGKGPPVPTGQEAGGPQSRSGHRR
jgi:hypothetical protein